MLINYKSDGMYISSTAVQVRIFEKVPSSLSKVRLNRIFMSYKLPTLNMVCGRAGTIPLTHESIQIDLLRSRFDLIRFDSNEYSIVVNRFGANLFVTYLKEF